MTMRPFPWEKSYPPDISWDAPLPSCTVPELIEGTLARFPDRTAIEYGGETISYRQLGIAIDRTAAALLRDGVNADTTIGLYLPNSPSHPVAFFGGLKAGARLAHLSPLDAERELTHKLHDSGARIVFTTNHPTLLGRALGMLDGGHFDRLIVCDDAMWGSSAALLAEIPVRPDVTNWTRFTEAVALPKTWPVLDKNDIAVLQYTGGTTGLPKGAMLSHANLTSAVAIYNVWFAGQHREQEGPARVIGVLPLFHIYALVTVLLRRFSRGDEILLRPRFDPLQTMRDIDEGKATAFPGVPTMWIALANTPGIDKCDFSSLRYGASGGAPLPVDVAERFFKLTGFRLRGGWGMSETCSAGTNNLFDGDSGIGSIGLPMPGVEMQVVALDDPCQVLPIGETGEFRVRGPNITRGYWNKPEENKTAFIDGFLLTGDIGYIAEDGHCYIVDRRKDMIISGGFNVYPQVIEQAIYEHPQVEEALVIGIPDSYRGEAAKAYVKLRNGSAGFTLEELQDFLKDKVGRHEMPAALEIRMALPRTSVGKLSKTELRAEAWREAKSA